MATISFKNFKEEILKDYQIAVTSRECSLLGRREVLTGKAKFGIFGDGKELPQIAMSRAFNKGDFRSGYYRDQTFMMALGELQIEHLFSGLYAHSDIEAEPMSAGRQMGGHYASRSIDPEGHWLDLTNQYNISPDLSCTAGQMPRLVGLAQASKIYRANKKINATLFSKEGNEVAWGTIGDASTSEGMFFEAINASGVLQIPMVISVWDDNFGISVKRKYQTTKDSISTVLSGFQRNCFEKGIEILTVKGWDYVNLIKTYKKASQIAREDHVPVFIHVEDLTQPQGHSTSGSHERYKSKERLEWEVEYDCNSKMKEWIIQNKIATTEELDKIREEARERVKQARNRAWERYSDELVQERNLAISLIKEVENISHNKVFIQKFRRDLEGIQSPYRKNILSTLKKTLRYAREENQNPTFKKLQFWTNDYLDFLQYKYSSDNYSETNYSPLFIEASPPTYNNAPEKVDGRIIIRDNFDALLLKYPELIIFGEDVGLIGDVNQGLEGLQKKYSNQRVFDTGIRETTIIGQGIGLALRGLRPIVEIQYLDYITYALMTLSDDLACLSYRSAGKQKAPVIIRTRGHRLEGIFHAGSPMMGLLGFLRGVFILVPRNMTQAAGFYNLLLASDQPALVIESLNGYRLKENKPNNLGEYTVSPGKVEVIKKGKDITVISYGSTLRLVSQAAKELLEVDIHVEVIDCQSLIPFDLSHDILKSLQKTNRLLVIDEDVPGGASAYIMQNILEVQNAYQYLDAPPRTLSAKDHRTAYGSDGDYFSKPNLEEIFEAVYDIMHDSNPTKYKNFISQNT